MGYVRENCDSTSFFGAVAVGLFDLEELQRARAEGGCVVGGDGRAVVIFGEMCSAPPPTAKPTNGDCAESVSSGRP